MSGVIRNANGHWIVGFEKPAHARGSLHAEIKALLVGLKTTYIWGMFPLQIETYSTEVILLLMHQQKELIIQHEFRQGNKKAHQMAKKATADLMKEKVFVEPPDDKHSRSKGKEGAKAKEDCQMLAMEDKKGRSNKE
ncbi:uncharacterized protein [Nicotiana sylvestris]|uniref:uncharacterized protein n=1 Tax=Nicotiana sylvestris TaxID=4096 RepID=UPI00388CA00E